MDAIFYVVRTGCAWRQLPKDFPALPPVYRYFTWWHDDGTVERVHDTLRGRVREANGRAAEPSAGLIDSQSVRTADTVPAGTRGFDAGKTRLDHPGVQRIWADQGFAGRLVEWSRTILGRELEIVRKAPDQRGFQVQPKRWAIERTFSWLTAHRRLARDYETSPARSETMIRWAMIGIMVRRLTRGGPATPPGARSLLRNVTQKCADRPFEGEPPSSVLMDPGSAQPSAAGQWPGQSTSRRSREALCRVRGTRPRPMGSW